MALYFPEWKKKGIHSLCSWLQVDTFKRFCPPPGGQGCGGQWCVVLRVFPAQPVFDTMPSSNVRLCPRGRGQITLYCCGRAENER